MNEKEWREQYLGVFTPDSNPQHVCGECKFFDNGCTTSQIERKYGNGRTPSCSEFEIKEKR